jgi:hypothetical protein
MDQPAKATGDLDRIIRKAPFHPQIRAAYILRAHIRQNAGLRSEALEDVTAAIERCAGDIPSELLEFRELLLRELTECAIGGGSRDKIEQ